MKLSARKIPKDGNTEWIRIISVSNVELLLHNLTPYITSTILSDNPLKRLIRDSSESTKMFWVS